MPAAVQRETVMLIQDEEGAKAWLTDTLGVSRETMALLERLNAFVVAEAEHQNLVSASTLAHMWQRHIVDSAQLLRFADPKVDEHWIDLGSGAGFPGLVIALIAPCRVMLVESRGLRIAYLERAIAHLGLGDRVHVAGAALERVPTGAADYISARAFAPLPRLLEGAARFSTENTRWLLPKGRNARTELESVSPAWQSVFHVEQSLTDADAAILVGTGSVASSNPPRSVPQRPMRKHRSRS
ncbi:16S rRNA (guanine(527)-N(7))-methyltransferase RsmG [Blastomonas sp.]|uniref:16S rRNA (guanine(527)-N(7))-methyltransferase RsmG n=1 Tax=Blastomonas sp. TaxID=1909299 RepID=UPI002588915F|nr:16S rRNA (guanine(527)-N(7))-methyltransferase RsmG [Blastomonas sp.]